MLVVSGMSDLLGARKGDWIQTFTGRRFWPMDPRLDDIDIEDIAHALAMKCRFSGHTDLFYSVAEHSILVSRAVKEHKLAALLHDASEAYLTDVPRPIKPYLVGYRDIEAGLDSVIAAKFDVLYPWSEEIHEVDTGIGMAERNALLKPVHGEAWSRWGKAIHTDIYAWPPDIAKKMFMREFVHLTTGE
jgi:hypothetical protein